MRNNDNRDSLPVRAGAEVALDEISQAREGQL